MRLCVRLMRMEYSRWSLWGRNEPSGQAYRNTILVSHAILQKKRHIK